MATKYKIEKVKLYKVTGNRKNNQKDNYKKEW